LYSTIDSEPSDGAHTIRNISTQNTLESRGTHYYTIVTDSAAKLLEAPHDFEVDATNQEKYNVLWNVIIKHHIVWISHEINRCETVGIRYY
jgi:hypothetical protein